jgi:hypothetical protein
MNSFLWLSQEVRWIMLRCYHAVSKKWLVNTKYYGKYKNHSATQGNTEIAKRIASGSPFSFCRFSFVEMDIMIKRMTEKYLGTRTYMWRKDNVDGFAVLGHERSYGIKNFVI